MEERLGDRWTFSARVQSDAGVAALIDSQIKVIGPRGAGGAFEASLAFASHPPSRLASEPTPSGVSFSFPSPTGSRLDLGQVAFRLSLGSGGAEMLLTLADSALIVDPEDNDGLAPGSWARRRFACFDLVLGYSSARGLVLEGSGPREGVAAGMRRWPPPAM